MRFPLVTTSYKPMPGIFEGEREGHEGLDDLNSELRALRGEQNKLNVAHYPDKNLKNH
jgi:hypothetical protein